MYLGKNQKWFYWVTLNIYSNYTVNLLHAYLNIIIVI